MKKFRLLISGLAIMVLVTSSLAFKPFSQGSVYCTSSCTTASLVGYKIDPVNGTTTIPCTAGVQPYVLKGNTDCVATDAGTKFSTTAIASDE